MQSLLPKDALLRTYLVHVAYAQQSPLNSHNEVKVFFYGFMYLDQNIFVVKASMFKILQHEDRYKFQRIYSLGLYKYPYLIR